MYELSFYERDKPIVKFKNNIWRPMETEDSNILTKIVNNSYLKRSHPQLTPIIYICDIDCRVKYYHKPDVIITAQAYSIAQNIRLLDMSIYKRNVKAGSIYAPNLYIPGVLFNGRGLWFCGTHSVFTDYGFTGKVYSRAGNTQFKLKKFNGQGMLS